MNWKRAALATLAVLSIAAPTFARSHSSGSRSSSGRTHVRGYTTKRGTYVKPYTRTHEDKSFGNNWSTKGNTNPITGQPGTKTHREHRKHHLF